MPNPPMLRPPAIVVHFVLPNDIDDRSRPSGGNAYDRRLADGLRALGWLVREHAIVGDWPRPDRAASARLAVVLASLPDGALVVVDGLVWAPRVMLAHAERLRLVMLVHLPLQEPAEESVLAAAGVVVTTSHWCREQLLARYDLPPGRVHVATPGVRLGPVASGTPSGRRLLCVAAVTRHKGHDVLLDALGELTELPWDCGCVGTLDREPEFVSSLRRPGLAGRVRFTGALHGAALQARYAKADLLVLPSRGETFGMVGTEALARGIPVVASDVGGVPEAMGRAPDGTLPGILVPPEDPRALADALRCWLGDPSLRRSLRVSARARRGTLEPWAHTVAAITSALSTIVPVPQGVVP